MHDKRRDMNKEVAAPKSRDNSFPSTNPGLKKAASSREGERSLLKTSRGTTNTAREESSKVLKTDGLTQKSFAKNDSNETSKKPVNPSSSVNQDDFAVPPFSSQIVGHLKMNSLKMCDMTQNVLYYVRNAPTPPKCVFAAVLVDTGLPSALRILLKKMEKSTLIAIKGNLSDDKQHRTSPQIATWGDLGFRHCKAEMQELINCMAKEHASIIAETLVRKSDSDASIIARDAAASKSTCEADSATEKKSLSYSFVRSVIDSIVDSASEGTVNYITKKALNINIAAFPDTETLIAASSSSVTGPPLTIKIERLQPNKPQDNELHQKMHILCSNLEIEYRHKVSAALRVMMYRRRFSDMQHSAAITSHELHFLPKTYRQAVAVTPRLRGRNALPMGTNVAPKRSGNRIRNTSADLSFMSDALNGNSSQRIHPTDRSQPGQAGSFPSLQSLNEFPGSFNAPASSLPLNQEIFTDKLWLEHSSLFYFLPQGRNADIPRVDSTGSLLSAHASAAAESIGSSGQYLANTGSSGIDTLQAWRRPSRSPLSQRRKSKPSHAHLIKMLGRYDDNAFSLTRRVLIEEGTDKSATRASFTKSEEKPKIKKSNFENAKKRDFLNPPPAGRRQRSSSLTSLLAANPDREQVDANEVYTKTTAPKPHRVSAYPNRNDTLKKDQTEDHRAGARSSLMESSHINSMLTKSVYMSGSYDGSKADMLTSSYAGVTVAGSKNIMSPDNPNEAHDTNKRGDKGGKPNEEMPRMLRWIVSYRGSYAINPFKRGEGEAFTKMRALNRRRWSHVFPKLWRETHRNLNNAFSSMANNDGYTYYGLNWKSLCQPAILPITTEEVPKVSDLVTSYNIQTNYDLILDHRECPFPTPQALLTEMVCQRLSQEYQLVEDELFDPAPYLHYVLSTEGKSVNQQSLNDKLSTAIIEKEKGAVGGVLFYVLSMGHRVQFLMYDPSNKQIKVIQLVSNKVVEVDGSGDQRNLWIHPYRLGRSMVGLVSNAEPDMSDTSPHDTAEIGLSSVAAPKAGLHSSMDIDKFTNYSTALYDYSIWVPQTLRFQVLTQQFWQFPSEFFWNKVDGILIGANRFDIQGSDGHRYGDEVRAKRLRFAVLPDIVTTDKEVGEYLAKIEKLLQFFRDKLFKGERIDVKFDRSLRAKDVEQTSDEAQVPSGLPINAASAATTIGNAVIPARAPRHIVSRKDYTVPIWLRSPITGEYASLSALGESKEKDIPKDYKPSTFYPEWAFLKYDASVSAHRVFLIELHWLVCDSWIMDKLVNLLFRRCSAWQLKLAQIPEFFISANLQLHPFRAQPYLAVPPTTSMPSAIRHRVLVEGNWSYVIEKPCYPSAVELVERLFLKVRGKAWIEDEARRTNWQELGLSTPDYQNNAKESALFFNQMSGLSSALHAQTAATSASNSKEVSNDTSESTSAVISSDTFKNSDSSIADSSASLLVSMQSNTIAAEEAKRVDTAAATTVPTNTPVRRMVPSRPTPTQIIGLPSRRYQPAISQANHISAPLTRGSSFHGGASPGNVSFINRAAAGSMGNSSITGTINGKSIGAATLLRTEMLRKRLQPSTSQSNLDRQYMHRQGVACVRVAAHGFVWLLNSGVRVASIGGKAERADKDADEHDRHAIPQPKPISFPRGSTGIAPSEPKMPLKLTLETRDKDKDSKDVSDTKEEVVKQAITAKDGTIINIKERRSQNPVSAIAAIAAAAEGTEKQGIDDDGRKAGIAPYLDPISNLNAISSKLEAERMTIVHQDTSERFTTKGDEMLDAETPQGRRELALRALKQLENFCIAVGNSYDVLVSVIETAMEIAESKFLQRISVENQTKELALFGREDLR